MAPNPYVKAVTSTNPPKAKKDEKRTSKVSFEPAASSNAKGKGKGKDTGTQEALRAEVLALGGDEEELEMLMEVESDSEVEGEVEVVKEKGKKGKAAASDKIDVSPRRGGLHFMRRAELILLPLAAAGTIQGPSLVVQVA
jgi:ribosome biogenesis protein MAK21